MSFKKVHLVFLLVFITFTLEIDGSPVPSPKPKAKSLPDPDPQFLLPRSSQQFTMYKPIQLQYPSNVYDQQQQLQQLQQQLPPGIPVRVSASGNPLLPIFHYSYNITHPPSRPGIVLTHHQLQYLTLQQQQQQRQQLQQRLSQQSQNSPVYAPVIIGNPNNRVNLQQQQIQQQQQDQQIQQVQQIQEQQQIRRQQVVQQQQQQIQQIQQQEQFRQQQIQQLQGQQFQPENLIQNSSDSASAQLTIPLAGTVEDQRDRDPEDSGIAFRVFSRRKNTGSSSRIIFDQSRPSEQLLNRVIQFPEKIVFSSAGSQGSPSQLQSPTARPYGQIQFGQDDITTPPTIQVPYLTTPSPLQQILQQQRNQQSSGFRSQLGLNNPALQASISQNPIIRGARVQNILVPSTGGQTPAGTQLLQRDYSGGVQVQYQTQNPPNIVYTNQNDQSSFINPSIANLGGTVITPENQRNKGQFIFSDPSTNQNPVAVASSAQKIFILPPDDGSSDGDDGSLGQNPDDTPSEIVITVVDDNSSEAIQGGNGESGKILTNFSLFLIPSTYKKCVDGFRKAHDGKCRLIIKLRRRRT